MSALAFTAGFVIGTRLLAALYAPRDLWYTIRTAWAVALRRIALWAAVTAVALWMAGGYRRAFLLGMAVHLAVHVLSWVLVTRAFPAKLRPTPVVE